MGCLVEVGEMGPVARWLQGGLALLVVLTLACQGGSPAASQRGGGSNAPREQVLRVPVTEPPTLDPGLATDHTSLDVIWQMFEGLISFDEQGNVYNINADTIAAEIAAHLQAEKLILLTDVDGILKDRNDPASRISRLTVDEAERLASDGVVSSGMLPKISAIAHLIRRGVKSAHIINGSKRNALLYEVFTDEGAGTMITK